MNCTSQMQVENRMHKSFIQFRNCAVVTSAVYLNSNSPNMLIRSEVWGKHTEKLTREPLTLRSGIYFFNNRPPSLMQFQNMKNIFFLFQQHENTSSA
jgi:hypothetical protein